MLITENILVALAGLKANIMRSLLTMLGIIIGIASVIAIMTVGNSITIMVNQTMQDLGANNLQMGVMQKSQNNESSDTGMNYGEGYIRPLEDSDLISQEMLDDFTTEYKDNIQYVLLYQDIATRWDNAKVSKGNTSANVNLQGLNADALKFKNLKMISGRQFIGHDYKEAKKTCVVSDKLVDRLFKGEYDSVIGKEIEVTVSGNYYKYYIVGVYEYVQDSFSFGASDNPTTDIYVPYETARIQTHNQNKGIQYCDLVTTIDTNNDEFATKVRDFFNVKYYSKNDTYEVVCISMTSMMDSMNSMISMIQLALSVIAAISLVVGGIGVMNIMLVSITERTKEIGTRKALGATNGSIRLQFITESVVICLIGGIIGMLAGVGLGTFAVKMMGYEAAVSVESIVIAVGFSMAIGVFFGYYPANKAAKLNPIDALRYE
ncbi:ABC transporter permease [Pseudobutyrivibrio ruminis]|uniref:ABC transporter n=1 Tax=Pseudobutyrivibrio ruminis TaxID=46206 RepID=A0A2G3DTH7_9FIRM|nr:ABC transporter permease [Pseudobutyrivibrio ruminis]PHU34193.1 ABC transporter [Pseudobutyrivibrio ruminis]